MRKAEATVAKVTGDIGERFSFHTAISAVQELVNLATKGVAENALADEPGQAALRHAAQTSVSVLFPFAPHITCELWEALGGEALWTQPWPEADPVFLERETVTVVVQVNGKLRDRLEVAPGADREELLARGPGAAAGGGRHRRRARGARGRRPRPSGEPGGRVGR